MIFERAAVGMAEVDARDLTYLRVNPSLCDTLGYTPEEMLGRSPQDFTHPEDRGVGGEQLRRLAADEIPLVEVEKRYLAKDGRTIWVLMRITRVPADESGPERFLSVVLDITDRKAAAEELQRTRESFGLALESGQMGWWMRDLTTGQVTWSPELERIFGLAPGAFGGGREHFMSFIEPEDRTRHNHAVQRAITTGQSFAVEFRFRRADGTTGWMEGRGRAIYDGDRPVTMYGIGLDVSERKFSEIRLRRILEAATVGVVVNDVEGKFLYANERLLDMLGYSQEELLKGELQWRKIQDPLRAAADDVALEQLRRTMSCEPYETELLRKDGTGVPVYAGAALVPDDTGEGRLGAAFITDLTALKEVEQELRSLNTELDQRVRERTVELQTAVEQLRAFTYHVSHDLRSPLRAIVATSRMLQEDHGGQLSEEAMWLLNRQAQAATKLGQLIDDLLHLSRLTQEELKVEQVDLSKLAREAAMEALAEHPESPVNVEVQDGLRAKGDPRLLQLALKNLIENAIKYSPDGGKVKVARRSDKLFFVSDQGIGIDPRYLEKIFEPFQRLHRDEEFSGTGIGLSNVRQVMARHGGRVWAESEPGKGSTFCFEVP